MAAFAADFFFCFSFMNCIDKIGKSLQLSREIPLANVNTF